MANTLKRTTELLPHLGYVVSELVIDTFEGIENIDVGPTELFYIGMDVSADNDVLLLWDLVNPTPGTDPPDYQIPTAADTEIFVLGSMGIPLTYGLSLAVANVGGTVCSGNPTNANTIHLATKPTNV